MVQGLGFLSKKSWHTKNIANQEKVWIAEEREKNEKAKTAELAKQIQQEREDDELSKIAGRKKLDRGIDWMYTGHYKESEMAKQDAAKESEEYLLGKKFAPAGKVVGDLDAAADGHDGVNAVVAAVDKGTSLGATSHASMAHASLGASNEASYAEDSVAQRNEAFRMRHEDPMFAVSLQAVRNEKSIEQRKDLYERAGIAVKAVKRDETNAPDDRPKKSHKSKKRRKEKERDHQTSEDEDSYRDRRREKKRKHRKSRATSDRDDSDSYSHSSEYDRSRHRSGHHKSSHRDKRHRSSRTSRRRDYSDESSYSSVDRRRDSRDRDGTYRARDDHRPASSRRDEPIHSRQSTDQTRYSPDKEVGEYGLQGRRSGQTSRAGDLGPDQALLQRRNEERDAERRRLREMTSRRSHRSAAEREQALRAMEQDARVLSRGRDHSRPREEEPSHGDELRGAKFIHQVSKAAHGIGNDGPDSMSRRMQQNHTKHQRNHDDSFL